MAFANPGGMGVSSGAAGRDEFELAVARSGKRDAARELVSEIYGWFTKGFDTTILQEAKSLAAALSS
jgi:hypothetical protein